MKKIQNFVNSMMLFMNLASLSMAWHSNSYAQSSGDQQADHIWLKPTEIRSRTSQFVSEVSGSVYFFDDIISKVNKQLSLKVLEPQRAMIFSFLGPHGLGKSTFIQEYARVIYADNPEIHRVSIETLEELFFSKKQGNERGYHAQKFLTWLEANKSKGGAILFHDLLNLTDLSEDKKAQKLKVIRKLLPMLKEQSFIVGNQRYELTAFTSFIRGNLTTELYRMIPVNATDTELFIQSHYNQLSNPEYLNKYLIKYGFDDELQKMLGSIFVISPQVNEDAFTLAKVLIEERIEQVIYANYPKVKVKVSQEISNQIYLASLDYSSNFHGMLNNVDKIIIAPLASLLEQVATSDKSLEISILLDKKSFEIAWKVNGTKWELVKKLSGMQISVQWIKSSEISKMRQMSPGIEVITPQISQINRNINFDHNVNDPVIVAVHELYGHWRAGYMLYGKNTATSVSTLPTRQAGGYVLDLTVGSQIFNSLTDYIRQLVRLKAGAVALFVRGMYTTGASGGEMSDAAHMSSIIDHLYDNWVFLGYSEASGEQSRGLVQKTIHHFIDYFTHYLMHYGDQHNIGFDFFKLLLQQRVLSKEQLDSAPAFEDASKVFMESFAFAHYRTLEKIEKSYSSSEKVEATNLIKKLSQQVAHEIATGNRLPHWDDIHVKLTSKVTSIDCSGFLLP